MGSPVKPHRVPSTAPQQQSSPKGGQTMFVVAWGSLMAIVAVGGMLGAEDWWRDWWWYVSGLALLALLHGALVVFAIKSHYASQQKPSGTGTRLLGFTYPVVYLILLGVWGVVWGRHYMKSGIHGMPPRGVAVSTVRTINTSLIVYKETYKNGYPATLEWLAPGRTCHAAGLVEPALAQAQPQTQGYKYYYQPKGERLSEPAYGCSQPGWTGYELEARPIECGKAGNVGLWTDETAIIREQRGGDCDAGPDSPPM